MQVKLEQGLHTGKIGLDIIHYKEQVMVILWYVLNARTLSIEQEEQSNYVNDTFTLKDPFMSFLRRMATIYTSVAHCASLVSFRRGGVQNEFSSFCAAAVNFYEGPCDY